MARNCEYIQNNTLYVICEIQLFCGYPFPTVIIKGGWSGVMRRL